jgi:hypothetical protein
MFLLYSFSNIFIIFDINNNIVLLLLDCIVDIILLHQNAYIFVGNLS